MRRKLYRVYVSIKERKPMLDDKMYDISEIDNYPHDRGEMSSFFELKEHAIKALKEWEEDYAKGYYKICKDCGGYFWLDDDGEEWFREKNMTPPKRCPECRKKRKMLPTTQEHK